MALMHSPVERTWQVSVKTRRALTDAVRRKNMGPPCLVTWFAPPGTLSVRPPNQGSRE